MIEKLGKNDLLDLEEFPCGHVGIKPTTDNITVIVAKINEIIDWINYQIK